MIEQSIVRVAGESRRGASFGTAFAIQRDLDGVYLLTCSHVVRDIGGAEEVRIRGLPATLAAGGDEQGLDLCVLYVRGLTDCPPVRLRPGAKQGQDFVCLGFERYSQEYVIRPVHGVLGATVGVEPGFVSGRFGAWELILSGADRLKPGHSGAPVIDKSTNEVVAIVTHREDDGKRGLALSIESLSRLDSLPAMLKSVTYGGSVVRNSNPSVSEEEPDSDKISMSDPFPLELVKVPAGDFLMGSNPKKDREALSWEQPRHNVYLSEFWIGKYTVTQSQFAVFMDETGYVTTAEEQRSSYVWTGAGTGIMKVLGASWRDPSGPRYGIVQVTGPFGVELVRPVSEAEQHMYNDHPVVQVSWHDAVAFCAWLRERTARPFRLPTEAEWEKAARGTDGRIYPWGNNKPTDRHANINDNVGSTTSVGSYPKGVSPYGAYDMIGNVWEWCTDWYDDDYFAHSPPRNPAGPVDGELKVYKGGAYGVDKPWESDALTGTVFTHTDDTLA